MLVKWRPGTTSVTLLHVDGAFLKPLAFERSCHTRTYENSNKEKKITIVLGSIFSKCVCVYEIPKIPSVLPR
jgi:hypothetical protein